MPIEVDTVIAWWFWMNLITCVFGVYVAAEKNRSLVVWGILCLIFGLVALIALAGIPAIDEGEYVEGRDRLRRQRFPDDGVGWMDRFRPPPSRKD